MEYVINYSIGSVLFLLIIMFMYFMKKKLSNKKDKIYSCMLISSFIAVVFDAIAAYSERFAIQIPIFLLYSFNMIFILSLHIFLMLLIVYFVVLTNMKLKKWQWLLITLPFILTIILTLISPLTKHAILYIDEDHIYQHGSLHLVLYITSVIYLIITAIIVIIHRHFIRPLSQLILCLSILVGLSLVLIQILYPKYLLTTSATAIGSIMMYYVLQSPSRYLDSKTNLYNRVALQHLLDEEFSKRDNFIILMFTIHSLNQINDIYGNKVQEAIINDMVNNLKLHFESNQLCRVYHTDFMAFVKESEYNDSHKELLRSFPSSIHYENTDIQYQVGVTVFKSHDFSNSAEVINIMDYVIHEKLNTPNEIYYINDETLRNYSLISTLENEISLIIKKNKIDLKISYVYNTEERMFATEVIPYINDPSYKDIDYTIIKTTAVRMDVVNELTEKIFDKCVTLIQSGFLELHENSKPYLIINIPQDFFANNNSSDIIKEKIDKISNKVSIDKIVFAFLEEDFSRITENELHNIMLLNDIGCKIIIDDFGVGYTNSNALLKLKLFGIRIFNEHLKQKMDDNTRFSFLTLISNINYKIDVHTICLGITDIKEKNFVLKAGIKYFQKD